MALLHRFLTDKGIDYLRDYLGLPQDVVPNTLKKSQRCGWVMVCCLPLFLRLSYVLCCHIPALLRRFACWGFDCSPDEMYMA